MSGSSHEKLKGGRLIKGGLILMGVGVGGLYPYPYIAGQTLLTAGLIRRGRSKAHHAEAHHHQLHPPVAQPHAALPSPNVTLPAPNLPPLRYLPLPPPQFIQPPTPNTPNQGFPPPTGPRIF